MGEPFAAEGRNGTFQDRKDTYMNMLYLEPIPIPKGKKGRVLLFLSTEVRMFGWAECQCWSTVGCSFPVLVGRAAQVS